MPPQMLHMILPRKDYEIVEDSWNVVGLRGTGLEGRHRQGCVRAVVPDDGRDEGHGRHGSARGRDDRDAVPDAVVDDVPCSASARRPSASPRARWQLHSITNASAVNSSGVAIKDDPLRHVRDRRGRSRYQRRAARSCWPTPTASTTWWTRARRFLSKTGPPAGVPRCGQCGVRCRRSTRSSPAAAATPRGWTNRCNGIGAMCMSARRTRSTFPGTVFHASAPEFAGRGSAGPAAGDDLRGQLTWD